ncbi:histidine kinase [Actinobaculum sp. 313]|uniref:sensor histidine kinase n=1 Tax=Actinobaculum sp. 313 TaxID=2495645 RepID=UPI0013DE6F2C|nr:histidine kinase [Actinobaculum sp. 313]
MAHGADSTVVTVTVIQLVIMLAMFFSLAQVFSSHRKLALANETIRQLTRITERERIGADLHDIVGQSLTALSLKAQLTGKLLDKETPDATEQARQQLYEMQKLSQEALADVRRVVRDARRLSVAEEISAARELLKTAEIQLIVLGDPLEVDDDAERAAAHVVREAAANIVHHSVAATRCTIQTWQRGVRISDNSPVLPGPAREALTAGGSGLAGLEERVRGADGTLRYGRTKGGWQVEAVFPASQPQGSKSSGEDAVAIQGGDWALPTAVT